MQPDNSITSRSPSTGKLGHELAGGIEDWEDIDGGDVDRYGFIMLRKATEDRSSTPELRPPQRVSTVSVIRYLRRQHSTSPHLSCIIHSVDYFMLTFCRFCNWLRKHLANVVAW